MTQKPNISVLTYGKFRKKILSKAEKRVWLNYQKSIEIIKDEDSFVLTSNTHHSKRMDHFLYILSEMFGNFGIHNSNDYTTSIRACFLEDDIGNVLRQSTDLSHILYMRTEKKEKLSRLLKEVDEFSYLVVEKVL